MDLRTINVVGDESLVGGFEISEPSKLGEYSSVEENKENMEAYLNPALEDISHEYALFIGDNSLDDSTIYYTAYIRKESDAHRYIPIIRQWMKVLYQLDYSWYFELRDLNCKDQYYFTLDSADQSFTCSEDWDDELIYAYIVSNLDNVDWFVS